MSHHTQQIRFCTSVDGTRIAYAICGEGPALVIAGQPFSHLESDWDCLVRQPLLDFLSQSYTLIRYDMRGTGLSDRDCQEYAFSRYVEDLAAVVVSSGFESYGLIGFTGGGALAVEHAASFPKKITRMVIVGSYLRGRLVRSTTASETEETDLIIRLIELGWGQDNPTFRQLFTYQFWPEGTAEQLHSYDELMRKATTAKNAALQLKAWFNADLRQIAPLVQTPTLVMHSRGDLRMPFEEGRLLAASIPSARFVPLDCRNHLPLVQDAVWPQFLDEITRFFNVKVLKHVNPVDHLTSREQAVMQLLVSGINTPDMAERLCMSEKTVRNHLSTIYAKLGVNSRVQAVLWMEENSEKITRFDSNIAVSKSSKSANEVSKDWIPPWDRHKSKSK